MIKSSLFAFLGLSFFALGGIAQERHSPYFVSYDHYMEELQALEIRTDVAVGQSSGIHTFLGDATEFEYGATRWWTPEIYVDWQHTAHEGNVFTGFRFENRFRLFVEPHKINPVLYLEYEHLNGADKVIKEVLGFDGKDDLAVPNDVTRHEHRRELEPRLILSSQIGEWNVTENFIAEKNLKGGPWEFGYTVGLSRPLPKKFAAGIEMYGGLGTARELTWSGTSHYIAPVFLWTTPGEVTIQVSPGFGLTDQSLRTIFRVGISKDIDDIGPRLRKLFHM
ncbi:MAG TPA: hypothetical protein VKY31_07315 [Terriglobia bacterium]|nr:hypothetical protein [Terriglobia bacterium]